MEASTGPSAAVSTDEILNTSPGVFRAALKRISREKEPAKWAVEQLKLGARLRARSAELNGSKRTRMLLLASKAFEEALCFYCDLLGAPAVSKHAPCASDAPPVKAAHTDSNDLGIELLLDVVDQATSTDPHALADALNLFAASCTEEVRVKDFRKWLCAGLNRGCALILLGKMSESASGSALLHLAVDACHRLLGEPVVHELRQESALVYINLAEALSTLSQRQDTEENSPYLAGAMESLATALWQTVPEDYRALVAPRPKELN